MDPRPAQSLDDWEFTARPINLHKLRIPTLDPQLTSSYSKILNEPFILPPGANAILAYLWHHVPQDASEVKYLFLASVGVARDDPAAERAEQIYDEVKGVLFGDKNIPATGMSISVVHRILSHRVQAETVLLLGPFTSTTEYAELPPVRKFTFYISLRPRPGYQAVNSKYSGWIPWLRPQRDHDLRFAFAHGNWATVRLFREVLDAVLGKHLNQTPDTVAIFRDPSCSTVVNEDDNLEGDFFIALNTVEAQELPRLNFHSPAGKRDPKFASAVKKRHGHCCTFSTAIQRFPEDDLEAAHIFPRPGHIIFLLLLKRFCPDTSVRSIDHFCNGLALWVALHRPWDDHRAAISVLRRLLLLAEKPHAPLFALQQCPINSHSTGVLDHSEETLVLLKLRFTQTMLEWFATRELQELLEFLGRPDPISSAQASISTATLPITVARSPPSDEEETVVDFERADCHDGVEDDEFEEESDVEEDDEVEDDTAPHYAGCFCDVDADEHGPCVLLLFGATQLWTAVSREAQ